MKSCLYVATFYIFLPLALDRSPDHGNTNYNGNDRQEKVHPGTAFPHARVQRFQPFLRTLRTNMTEQVSFSVNRDIYRHIHKHVAAILDEFFFRTRLRYLGGIGCHFGYEGNGKCRVDEIPVAGYLYLQSCRPCHPATFM